MFHHRGRTHRVTSKDWLDLFEAGGFSAAIFDCDGTLVDSSEAHFRAMQAAAREQGHDMVKEWYQARNGLDRQSLFQAFHKTVSAKFDVHRAIASSIELFDGCTHLIKPVRGVLDFAGALRMRKIPLAVATNAEHSVAKVSLIAANAINLFDHLVSISDDVQPKPSPEMFERAANLSGEPHHATLVVEDSPQGIQAANAAKMSALQLLEAR